MQKVVIVKFKLKIQIYTKFTEHLKTVILALDAGICS